MLIYTQTPLRVARAVREQPALGWLQRRRRPPLAQGAQEGALPTNPREEELLEAVRPFIQPVCQEMQSHFEGCRDAGCKRGAQDALAAAEASGAIPRLSPPQRELLKSALARAAAAYHRVDKGDQGPELEWPDLSDDELVFAVKPLAREMYEALVDREQ